MQRLLKVSSGRFMKKKLEKLHRRETMKNLIREEINKTRHSF